MSQSPELAGGAGFTYEGNVAAYYLAALLAEAYAPGIEDRIVSTVSVQQRDFGEPLDDVIVDFLSATAKPARLSLQVKRALTISAATSNADFRDIIRDSWATLAKPDFRIGVDRYGAATGTVAANKKRALSTLCSLARESLTSEHFEARFAPTGNASPDVTAVRSDIATLLDEALGSNCTTEQLRRFLAHFVLIEFDFLREGAADPTEATNMIRESLAASETGKSPLVWSRLVQLARDSAGQAGQFDRPRLVVLLSQIVRLRGAVSMRSDLERFASLAQSYADQIQDDVGGTNLDRPELQRELDQKLRVARLVQIRGLPGTGKSVLLQRNVQLALARGPVLFLKGDRLEGTSWISFAAAHGLSGARLEDLLAEVGAAGTPVLYIDAIDRVEKAHQGVILDVVRAVARSPLLANWQIVVSLRDTGIELLRNWLGDLLDAVRIETVNVAALDDDEAEALAQAKPHLRPLLFGPTQVRGVVRRPFFAKVLNQSFMADAQARTFTPRSEIDLIENWWQRGGYNATGQDALERQRALIDLAGVRARELSQPIRVARLRAIDRIDALRTDGILQAVRVGHSVQFAHDIFFEWAFFHLLADRHDGWLDEIRACGQPPAAARAVELLAQWEYADGNRWSGQLGRTETSLLRSQWTRAWLLGPIACNAFDSDDGQFASVAFADNFLRLRKTLVWFQAEKTAPNPGILAGSLPADQRQRVADALGIPSDFAAWRRLISFLLRHINDVPARLYPDVVAVFEVWQNAAADVENRLSKAILTQCSDWLAAIDTFDRLIQPDDDSCRWTQVPDLDDFRSSLCRLILRGARAEPSLAEAYLRRHIAADRIRDETYEEIVGFSFVLARTHPELLVDLTLAHLKAELPDDQVAREQAELKAESERREVVQAKPAAARSDDDAFLLRAPPRFRTIGYFSDFDVDRLAIDEDRRCFWPPSPLREPFRSLFATAPQDALRLLRELSNHAITAWRQFHRYSRHHQGTPIPVDLTFPWGTQRFWGGDREYLWFRAMWAPKPLACGFLALEEWCLAELERGHPVDDLVRLIVEGNECIAILAAAALVAVRTEAVSEAVFPLVTCQRLLAADFNRLTQEPMAASASLIGFERADREHAVAIQASNARDVRQKELRGLAPLYVFNEVFAERTREALRKFTENLPYQLEEQRNVPDIREDLLQQALTFAALADPANYRAYRTDEPDKVAVVHVNPAASDPENVSRVEQATLRLQEGHLWMWAVKTFENRTPGEGFTIAEALTLAHRLDGPDLFVSSDDEEDLGVRRGAVAAVAAVALTHRQGCSDEDLAWARHILRQACSMPEVRGLFWNPSSIVPWHHAVFAARGLSADLLAGTAEAEVPAALLALAAHPLEVVSLAAVEEAFRLWRKDPRLAWSALLVAFALCNVPPRPQGRPAGPREPIHSAGQAGQAVKAALASYTKGNGWPAPAAPPPAWVKVASENSRRLFPGDDDYDMHDVANADEVWSEPETWWHSEYAAKLVRLVPVDEVLESPARSVFLDFLEELLAWTNQRNAPPWVKSGHRRQATSLIEWTHSLGSLLGRVAGGLTLDDLRRRFLDPIFALAGDNCWALLTPFADTYVCAYVYDAPEVPSEAIRILDLCLGRLLVADELRRDAYRGGQFSGFDQPRLVRTLMFVSVERADMAARYVNGDWSALDRILPLIDRFIRAAGWAASVMGHFLTLCERARAVYPAESFADQVLVTLSAGPEGLKGWHGTTIPARIAALVQHLADRDSPMSLGVAQKLLNILDMLVDMGDRRSAALQLGEAFREVRLNG